MYGLDIIFEGIDSPDGTTLSDDSFDHLFYMRVFEGCNLYCKHCFVPHNPKRIKPDDFTRSAEILKNNTSPGDNVVVQWHGGEPTALGAQYLRDFIGAIDDVCADRKIMHTIQTNLININDELIDLYKDKFSSTIGVSWDPEIRLLKGSNQLFSVEFESNVSKATAAGLSLDLIITVTKPLIDKYIPEDIIEYAEHLGARTLHLEKLTSTGEAISNWGDVGVTHADYSNYMSKFLLRYINYLRNPAKSPHVHISPFDGLLKSFHEYQDENTSNGYGCWSGKCDTRFHTIDADGYKKGCTAVSADEQNYSFQAQVSSVVSFVDIRKERTNGCYNCTYQSVCSSGCMASDLFDGSGDCAGAYKLLLTADSITKKQRG